MYCGEGFLRQCLCSVPVDHYETIYIIDQRYYKNSVIELAKKNKVTDVIFANNLSAIGSSAQQKLLNGILK